MITDSFFPDSPAVISPGDAAEKIAGFPETVLSCFSANSARLFQELSVPYVKTRTWTTDAIYRETRREMELRRSEGCSVVEMECALIMAAAQFRNIPVYQFLYAKDCLDEEKWDKRVLGSMPADMRERIFRIALEAAVRL